MLTVGVLGLFSAYAVLTWGYWALVLPLYVALGTGAILRPHQTAIAVLGMMIAVEPKSIDSFASPLSQLLYELPPEARPFITITITPMEATLVLAAVASLFHRARGEVRAALPLVVWLAPLALIFGMVYGVSKGATQEIAYHDGRGLVYGCFVFILVRRLNPDHQRTLFKVLIVSTIFLAVTLLGRYFFVTRGGQSPVPLEFAYAHESPLFLAMGFVAAVSVVARTDVQRKQRLLTVLYVALLAGAMMATGRRSGTLVFLVGALVLVWYLIPKRPLAVTLFLIPSLVAGTAYLGAYWNHEYGAAAQPARAIRSQFDPSARDASSDTYRDTEKFNVIQTIRDNRVFGVGFGNTFGSYQPLPDLTSFWPLQHHTPHQNLLWLWLKMGAAGITIFLAFWVLAVKRCIVVLHSTKQVPPLALTVVAVLTMYIAFTMVDLALTGTRSTAPLAAALALAFSLRLAPDPARADGPGADVATTNRMAGS